MRFQSRSSAASLATLKVHDTIVDNSTTLEFAASLALSLVFCNLRGAVTRHDVTRIRLELEECETGVSK